MFQKLQKGTRSSKSPGFSFLALAQLATLDFLWFSRKTTKNSESREESKIRILMVKWTAAVALSDFSKFLQRYAFKSLFLFLLLLHIWYLLVILFFGYLANNDYITLFIQALLATSGFILWKSTKMSHFLSLFLCFITVFHMLNIYWHTYKKYEIIV